MEPIPRDRYQPGDVICGQCGTGNSPTRHFCRRCGAALADAVTVRTPWWRRIFPARQTPVAGQRPAGMPAGAGTGGAGRWVQTLVLAVIGALVVGSLLSYAVVSGFREGINHQVSVVTKSIQRAAGFGSPISVRPASAQASSAVAGHPPTNLVDLISDDYWAADLRNDPQPQIVIVFTPQTDLDYLLVTSGAGRGYASLARPRDVQLTYSDGSTERLTLQDDPKPVKYDLHGFHVSSVTMRILTVYPAGQSTQVAIAELEFFRLG